MRPNFNPRPSNITFLLTLAMVPVYLGAGYLFIGTNLMIDRLPAPRRYYVGLVFVGWAIFRGITVYLRYKQMKREEQENDADF